MKYQISISITLKENYHKPSDILLRKNIEPYEGAFSVVKRCVHKKSNDAFAVKMISTTKMSKRDFEKLEREARICQKLRHENIIRLHETMNDEKK